MTIAAVVFENVKKHYEKNQDPTIQEFSLSVAKGEFVVLVGPSGCGKSTLLRLLAGLIPHTSGKMFIGDRDVTAVSPKERDVAMVFQNYALFPHMTVFENIAFGLRIRKWSSSAIDTAVHKAAKVLQIDTVLDKKPAQLSGGQRQRVALGRALVREPKVFLFDEPLSNLDAKLRGTMRREIVDFHREVGAATIYVTPDQLEAMSMADRIVVLDRGVVQQIGTPYDIYRRPCNLFVAEFVGSPSINLIEGQLERQANETVWRSAGLKLALPQTITERLGKGTEFAGKVTLGVRPEDIRMLADDDPSGNSFGEDFHSEVLDIELLGDDELLLLSCQGQQLRMKTKVRRPIARGESLRIGIDVHRVHLFGAQGRSMMWGL
jgi:multiple sugar transport system ATP-binding protein